MPFLNVVLQFKMFFLVYKKNKDGGRVKFHVSYAYVKEGGRSLFYTDWGSLLFSFDR